MDEIKTLELISLKDHKFDEYWLQNYICENSSCLGLGDLELVTKEKRQSSGGRLDILMKGSDDELYEIEVMLGETDESHITRTIEYWDIEKKKRPKRQHTAVLVAEKINSRFYNVINLLSYSVPIIGIQANLYKQDDSVSMVFTKIIDSFEEPELEDEDDFPQGFEYVKEKYPETSQVIDILVPIVVEYCSDNRVNYRKGGATIFIKGKKKIVINRRGNKQASISYKVSDEDRTSIEELLDKNSISFDYKNGSIRIWVNPNILKDKIELHKEIIEKIN